MGGCARWAPHRASPGSPPTATSVLRGGLPWLLRLRLLSRRCCRRGGCSCGDHDASAGGARAPPFAPLLPPPSGSGVPACTCEHRRPGTMQGAPTRGRRDAPRVKTRGGGRITAGRTSRQRPFSSRFLPCRLSKAQGCSTPRIDAPISSHATYTFTSLLLPVGPTHRVGQSVGGPGGRLPSPLKKILKNHIPRASSLAHPGYVVRLTVAGREFDQSPTASVTTDSFGSNGAEEWCR